MFFTVKQYSHIRDWGSISCHVQSTYLPKTPSTPQGYSCAGLPATLVNVCGRWLVCCGCRLASSLLSVAVCLWLCGEMEVFLWLWVCLFPIPSPVSLLLPNQTFHISQWCFLKYVCGSEQHSSDLLISSLASSLLVHLSIFFPGCLFPGLFSYLLWWPSPYYLQTPHRCFMFWMSHAAILSYGQLSITPPKQSVVTDFGNINILWGGFLCAVN